MNQQILLITRAAVMVVVAAYLWRAGKDSSLRQQRGWNFILVGFALLLFGFLLQLFSLFSAAAGLDTALEPGWEFILRDVAGYLLGMLLLVIGFMRWCPSVRELAEARAEWERAGAAMEKDLEMFRTICVQAPYGIGVIDRRHKLRYCNRALAEMHGYRAEELAGQDISILHRPEQMPLVKGLIKEMLEKETETLGEVPHARRDGTVFPTLMAGSVVRNRQGDPVYLAATMIDITGRKEREDELNRLSGALEGLAEMVVITDLAHRIIHANPAAEKILGYTPEEMIGLDSREFFEGIPGNPERLAEKMEKEAAGGTWKGELLNRRKDGELIDVHLTMTVLRNGEGRAAGYVGITRDITGRKQAEANLARTYRQLRDLKGQLIQSEKLSSLGLLAAGVAHELNSPLDGLMTMLRLTRKHTPPGSTEHEQASTMLAAAEHMARIVGDLTAFARRSEGDYREVDLNEAIEATLSFSFHHLAAGKVTVVKHLDRRLRKVRGDRGRLQQVVLNLITNARDAMAEGGRLEIGTENSPDRPEVTVTVSDEGAGIAPEHLDRLFDPFFTTKQPGEGIGLGLSVAYGIIESHRGEITVESEPGRGTVFTIRLPAAGTNDG